VNDHHKLNEHGYKLLTYFEKGPTSVPLTPGGAAMEPYVCPGGELTIGYGCTKYFGGMEVLPTDRIADEVTARALLADQLVEYEQAVRDLVTVPLNSNQFGSLVCFAYNCGIKALAGSTLLRHINASRFDDAADAFGMWLYATSGRHKQALRGLLRRRYSESCYLMSYDFEVACSDEAVALVRERPPNDIGTDKVLFKTPFKDVLSVAQRYPLPPLDEPELVLTVKAEPPTSEAEAAGKAGQPGLAAQPQVPAVPAPKPSVGGSSEAAPVAPPVPAPQPTPARPAPASVPAKPPKLPDPPVPIGQQTTAVDGAKRSEEWSNGTKAMWQSRRFYGLVLIMAGRLWMLKTGSNAFLGAVSDPLVMEFVGGFGVMIAGELIQSWGRAKAKKALH
jgi:lysozyme